MDILRGGGGGGGGGEQLSPNFNTGQLGLGPLNNVKYLEGLNVRLRNALRLPLFCKKTSLTITLILLTSNILCQ